MTFSPTARRRFFGVIVIGLSTAVSLILVEMILRLVPEESYDPGDMESGLLAYDDRLGWSNQPGWSGEHRHRDFSVRYTVDSHGFRKQEAQSSETVIIVLGDSFTFGIGVEDDQTFSALLSGNLPDITTRNAAIVGSSTDQQVLLLEKLERLQSFSAAMLVVYLGNDLIDNNHPFPIQATRAKPFFSITEGGNLELQNYPVPFGARQPVDPGAFTRIISGENPEMMKQPGLLRHSVLWRRSISLIRKWRGYPELSFGSNIEAQLTLFEKLIHRASRSTPRLFVTLIGGRSYVESPGSYSAQYQEYLRQRIKDAVFPDKVQVIDAAAPMRKAFQDEPDASFFFPNEGHFNPYGHQWLAEFLKAKLNSIE